MRERAVPTSVSSNRPEPRPRRSFQRRGPLSCQQVRHATVACRLAATIVTTSHVAGLLPGLTATARAGKEPWKRARPSPGWDQEFMWLNDSKLEGKLLVHCAGCVCRVLTLVDSVRFLT